MFKQFRDWVKADVFQTLFDVVSKQSDMEYAMVNVTNVRVHRHGQGVKEGFELGHRSQSRWINDQNIGADWRSWVPGSIRFASRAAPCPPRSAGAF